PRARCRARRSRHRGSPSERRTSCQARRCGPSGRASSSPPRRAHRCRSSGPGGPPRHRSRASQSCFLTIPLLDLPGRERRGFVSRITTAEIVSVGSELTTGETRDTNAGDIARDLADRGVTVTRVTALPDRLGTVVEVLRDALGRAQLVVTTGGLGPTPDDLT